MINWNKYQQFFKPHEFECRCGCGLLNVELELIERLMIARDRAKFPFVITSGSRCIQHNYNVGGHKNSAHLTGHACDIWCNDMLTRGRLVKLFTESWVLFRIGLHPRFIHIDVDWDRPKGIYLY